MRGKNGVSPLIGYVLLIAGVLAVSGIVFSWLTTYVPQESAECPADVSLTIRNVSCAINLTQDNIDLRIAIRNNGLFNVDGFFILAANNTNQTLGTIDLIKYLPGGAEGIELFNDGREPLAPSEEVGYIFNISREEHEDIKSIEIIPSRFEVVNDRRRFTSCGNAKIKEIINCEQSI